MTPPRKLGRPPGIPSPRPVTREKVTLTLSLDNAAWLREQANMSQAADDAVTAYRKRKETKR